MRLLCSDVLLLSFINFAAGEIFCTITVQTQLILLILELQESMIKALLMDTCGLFGQRLTEIPKHCWINLAKWDFLPEKRVI